MHIEVETGKSTELEAKWIIGFTFGDLSACVLKRIKPLIYCKLVQLSSNMKKVGAQLCVKTNTNPESGRPPLRVYDKVLYSSCKLNSKSFCTNNLCVGKPVLKA